MVYVIDPSTGPAYLVTRSSTGASLYRFDAGSLSWRTAAKIPDLNDSAFGEPQFYRSLKHGRVDGDYDRLFARWEKMASMFGSTMTTTVGP